MGILDWPTASKKNYRAALKVAEFCSAMVKTPTRIILAL